MSFAAHAVAPARRRWLFITIATAVLIGLLTAIIVPLSASAATAQVSGKVVGPTGSGLSGVTVQAVFALDGVVAVTTTTSSSGAFTLSGIDPDDYTLKFSATTSTYQQYLGGSATLSGAQKLSLYSGESSTITAALSAAGTVTGTVKTSGGTAVSGATVTLYSLNADEDWVSVKTTTTTSTGYKLASLVPGEYRIKVAKSGYPSVFSGGAAALASASNVGVIASKSTTANFVFGTGAKVSGVVSGDLATPAPLAGVTVQAWRFVGSAGAYTGVEKVGVPTTTSATGAYTIAALPAGDYTLNFTAVGGSGYGSAFLGGATSTGTATVFSVGSGVSLTGKNITLIGSGSLGGSVKSSGVGIANVRVTLTGQGDDADVVEALATTYTDALGLFQFSELAAGDYTILVGSFEDAPGGVVEETGYQRRSGNWTLNQGQALTNANLTTIARVAMTPSVAPEISTWAWKVGAQLETSIGTWPSSGYGATGYYIWYRNGVEIPGERGYAYIAQPGDLGYTITSKYVRFDWALGEGSSTTAATPVIGEGDAPGIIGGGAPTTGTSVPRVGDIRVLNTGTWETANTEPGDDPGILWTVTWQRSTNGITWTDIDNDLVHEITADDYELGPRLQVVMHGERYGYGDIDTTVSLLWVEENTFSLTSLPTVKKTSTSYVVSKVGVWSPAPTDYSYEWLIYDENMNLQPSVFATSIPLSSVVGDYVLLRTTPLRAHVNGTGVNVTVQLGKIHTTGPAVPITGDPRVGQVLTAPAYTWVPGPETSTYKWQYYSSKSWKTISGVTSSTYQVGAGVKGKKLRVITTVGAGGYGSASKTSAATAAVKTGLAPVNTVTPSFTGSVAINESVTVNSGSWTPVPTAITYQWRVRSSEFGSRTSISGATFASYTIPTSYENKYLDVLITVKRSGQANATYTLDLGQVLSGTLVNKTKPTVVITDEPVTGTRLTVASNGTWSPSATSFNYQWVAIAGDGSDSVIGGASFEDTDCCALFFPVDLVVTASKVGYADGSVRVPAKNGQFWLASGPGINTSGGAQVGETFTAIDMDLNSPPDGSTLSRQWQVFSSGTWKSIAGATSATFVPSATYLNKQIRLQETVSKARYTSLTTTSTPETVTLGDELAPGSGLDAPFYGSDILVGHRVTVQPGPWSQTGATFSYAWSIADSEFGTYVPIAGATSASYTIKEADFGKWVHATITAKKPGFADGIAVLTNGEVAEGTITATKLPVVSRSGYTFSVTTGTWTVSGFTSVDYEWRRYSADGTSFVTVGANQPTYTQQAADVGRYLSVAVSVAKAPAWDQATVEVTAQLGGTVAPTSQITIDGDLTVGSVLSAVIAGWKQDLPTVRYQWLRNGSAISGATADTYTLANADLGKKISLKITAKRLGFSDFVGTVDAGTPKSAVIPTNVTVPTISVPGGGEPKVGSTITASPGTWSLTSMTFAYQWYREGVPITGATASSYPVSAADFGNEIWAKVTASKPGYTSASALTAQRTVLIGDAAEPSAALTLTMPGGSVLSNTIAWNLPVTVKYQWRVSTDGGSTYSDIAGETGTSLNSGSLNSGDKIVLRITASRPGHTTAVLENLTALDIP